MTQRRLVLVALHLIVVPIAFSIWLAWNQSAPLPPLPPLPNPLPIPHREKPVNLADGPPVDPANSGYTPDPEGTKRFLRTLARPLLLQANPMLQVRDGEPVLLYRALVKTYRQAYGKDWVVGRQGIGDCVSWGWAHAADIHLAVMYQLGDTGEWREAATEAIYGGSRVEARGLKSAGYSDGSYGGAAAKWVSEWGVVFRQKYDAPWGELDLRVYSSSRAKEWGNYGCGGAEDSRGNSWFDQQAKSHPIKQVALVRTFQEAAAAIQSGYPVAVCSGQGFASKRDKDGFSPASGSWAHCMCFVAVRFDRPGLLCLNSWGPTWIAGPKWPDDQPDGSFWVEAAVAERMLAGNDSFAVSGYQGFPYRELRHSDWVSAPVRPRNSVRSGVLYATAL